MDEAPSVGAGRGFRPDADPPVLRGERVTLRPLEPTDAPRIAAIGREPEVARWWPGLDEAEARELAEGRLEEVSFAVELDGETIGLAQYWEEHDPEHRHAGIDLALATAFHDKGLGSDVVRTLARFLVRERGHHRLTIDPAAANARAIRCYEKVGFRPVGVMREYERGADGTWHDGMLMDLIASEAERLWNDRDASGTIA